MQSFDGPVVTQFQMCWVALTAWLCNSTGPPPLWLKMLSALKKNLPLSGGYQRWSFLKDMLLVWKVKYSWARTWKCHLLFLGMSKRHIFIKLCWRQLQVVGPLAMSNKGEPMLLIFYKRACCKQCLATLKSFASFKHVHKNNPCAINRLWHSEAPLNGMHAIYGIARDHESA